MDKIVSKILGLGIPGLYLLVAINATGYAGAAAITTALSATGPWGMIGGIATLGISVLIIEGLSEYGFDAILTAVVKEMYKRGESKQSLLQKIEKYPVSKDLKRKLHDAINTIDEPK